MSGNLLAALVSVALTAAPVPAQPAPAAAPASNEDAKLKRAEELFNNGRQLFKEGSYEAAILAFQESYELSKLPEILYNIGNSYEKLGDFANARKYLDQYRAFAPEKERELLTRRIQNLDQRLREQEEKARQEREKQAAEAKPPEPDPNLVKPQPEPQPPVEQPKQKDRVFGPAAGALTGVAVLGLGLGIGFGVSAQKQRDEALKSCSETAGGATYCLDDAQSALDKQRARAIGADVSFIVAGAAAVALIAVIAVKAGRKKNEQRAAVAPTFSSRGAGLALGLRF